MGQEKGRSDTFKQLHQVLFWYEQSPAGRKEENEQFCHSACRINDDWRSSREEKLIWKRETPFRTERAGEAANHKIQ